MHHLSYPSCSQEYCPVNFCQFLNPTNRPIHPSIQNLPLPLVTSFNKQKISLKKIRRPKQLTKRTQKHINQWEQITRSNTYRMTENNFYKNSQHYQAQENLALNTDHTNENRLSLTCQNKAPFNNPNTNKLKRKAMRSTEFAPVIHTMHNYESVERKTQSKGTLIDSFHLGLKELPQSTKMNINHKVTQSLTQRQFVPTVSQKVILNKSKIPSIFQPQSITLIHQTRKLSLASSMSQMPMTKSIPNYRQRQERDFQNEYETVNSVFNESSIDERVSESSVEIDFFHPSRGKIYDRVEQSEVYVGELI